VRALSAKHIQGSWNLVATTTRRQIVEAADKLFYERGFEATSFADIAEVVGLSRGNFYYHFKTKDEILEAVIAHRLSKTRAMLDAWEVEGKTPTDRIRSFINILIMNRAKIMAHGCPVGTLCNELAKLDHVAMNRAAELFTALRDWLSRQFRDIGHATDADELAMHILMRSQGGAALATALRDEACVRGAVEDMCQALAAKRPTCSPH